MQVNLYTILATLSIITGPVKKTINNWRPSTFYMIIKNTFFPRTNAQLSFSGNVLIDLQINTFYGIII